METLHTSSIQINTCSTNSYEYSRSIMIRYLWILIPLIFQTYFFHNSQLKNVFQNLFSFPSTNLQVLQFSWNNNSKIYKVFPIFRYCVLVLLLSLSPNVQSFFHGRNLERFITWPALMYNYKKGERGNSWARAIILVQCVQFRSQCLHIHGFNWVSLISGRLGGMLYKAIRYYGGVRNIWRAKAIEKDC